MMWRHFRRLFVARPNDAQSSARAHEVPSRSAANDGPLATEVTITITLHLRSRIEIAAIQRRTTVAELLENLLAREFLRDAGDAT